VSTPTVSVPFGLGLLGAALLDLLEDVRELVAQEDRDDRRRRLVGAQAVVVARVRDDRPQQRRVLVHRADDRRAEHQELRVLVRRVARIQQVALRRAAQRPVQVLARAVDAGERLLVQQAGHAVLLRHALQRVMISCWWSAATLAFSNTGAISYWPGATSLCRVLTGTPSLYSSRSASSMNASTRSGIAPKYWSSNSWPFGGLAPNSVRPARDQVGAREEEVAVDQEVLLLGPAVATPAPPSVWPNSFRMRCACLFSACIERSTGVFLSSASPVHDTNAVGMHSVVPLGSPDVRRARHVPRRVAAGLERRPDAARREARRVRLALDQLLAVNSPPRAALAVGLQEAVVLLGRQAGQRIEDVRVVRRALLDRPVLHRHRHGVGPLVLHFRWVNLRAGTWGTSGLSTCHTTI
jgi:hypothetical protein